MFNINFFFIFDALRNHGKNIELQRGLLVSHCWIGAELVSDLNPSQSLYSTCQGVTKYDSYRLQFPCFVFCDDMEIYKFLEDRKICSGF